MDMRIEHKLEPKLTQELKVTPQMILINRILQLQRLELKEEIELALKENPALELVEEQQCPRCGEPLDDGVCRNCESSVEYAKQDAFEYKKRSFDDLVNNWDSGHFEDPSTYERSSSDDEFDPIANTPSESNFREQLIRNFLITYSELSEIETQTARDLIGLIDDKGLIEINDDELAESLGVLSEVVKMMREKITRLDPVGIGARSATQAMLTQLDVWHEQSGKDVTIEKQILTEYRDLLARGNYSYIAKLLGSNPERIREATEFIKSQLYAYPSAFFDTQSSETTDSDFYPEPDVIIRETKGEFYPEVQDSGLPHFRISNYYLEAYQKIKNGSNEYTEDEKKHIKQYLEKAQFFLTCINQRRETMIRICNFLIKFQNDFLKEGIKKLHELTREKVAHEISFHPSTISRALKDKYVQLPNRSIHPFDIFFDYRKVMILAIREIIEKEETVERMLTDDVIADKMKTLGFDVARRTIAKYRERGGIPPKNIRKQRLVNRATSSGGIT